MKTLGPLPPRPSDVAREFTQAPSIGAAAPTTESNDDMFSIRWEEFFADTEHRFEKIQMQFQKQHEIYRQHFRQMQAKLAGMIGWANERKQSDTAWFELVEQHQQALQLIEAKLSQWQKSVSDQELMALNANSEKLRVEKLQMYVQRQTEAIETAIQEMRDKVDAVHERQTGRQTESAAVEEMIDRQRRLIQSFELRLRQAEKVISEQELQLANSRAELKEAVREIARLRR